MTIRVLLGKSVKKKQNLLIFDGAFKDLVLGDLGVNLSVLFLEYKKKKLFEKTFYQSTCIFFVPTFIYFKSDFSICRIQARSKGYLKMIMVAYVSAMESCSIMSLPCTFFWTFF